MKSKNRSIVMGALLVLLLAAFSISLFAQGNQDMIKIGKQGEITFDSPVRVGDQLLKEGTYQIQHVMEGEDHAIVFRKMSRDYYRQLIAGREVARVKCRVEPLGEKAKHGGVRFGTNVAGEKTVEEVHVRGESVKHLI